MTPAATYGTPTLTADEVRVLGAVARGLKRHAVAGELGISEATVKARMNGIAGKFGVCDWAGMVGEAIRLGQLRVDRVGPLPGRFDQRLSEVLVRIAAGKSNQDIARELHLSKDGVQSRVKFLYLVLGARTRPHAVALGVRCGALVLAVPTVPKVGVQ